ncbi:MULTISPECIES: MaoC family dehydratase [unclassified Plantactinospora]|uniref:MaoC family dehydratase n=1 Tax=unclassified Plantactinospora TaxID=2631981 RepID=UPI000D15F850|nr:MULTISPECIES: MaoC family dehydratase [unclassified Plantactinospora]AVT29014.1 dehydratase [Plantactinospora sp. BC1]AVT35419.1 dehydratase [Plantactinospora sp. BB1]
MRTFASLTELAGAVGEQLGPGPWHRIEQDRVNAFADATGDHQWIHVDPERAATGPYGTTVAHGFLTLSLLPVLVGQLYRVERIRLAINYGLNRVRFPAPLRTGDAVRAGAELLQVDPVAGGGAQVVLRVTVEPERGGKPCCVAETVTRLYAEEELGAP